MDKNPLHSTHIQITLTDQDITEIQVTLSIINTEFKERVWWSLLRIQTKRVSVVHRKDIAYIYRYIIYRYIYIYTYAYIYTRIYIYMPDKIFMMWRIVSEPFENLWAIPMGQYTREFLIVWRNRYNMTQWLGRATVLSDPNPYAWICLRMTPWLYNICYNYVKIVCRNIWTWKFWNYVSQTWPKRA